MPGTINSAPPRYLMLAAGGAMIAVSLIGYLTVADDLRHVGEFAGVSALLLAGLALVADAYRILERQFALRWVAAGVLLGAALGTAIDATAAGLVVGLVLGIATARRRTGR